MNKVNCLFLSILVAVFTGACTSNPFSTVKGMVNPGGKIGEMTVEQGAPTLIRPFIWQFCEGMPDGYAPNISTTDCDVPMMSGVTIPFGWLAKESKLDSNWKAMKWELFIDGYQVDLDTFDWYETDYPAHGEAFNDRTWYVTLKDLTPGRHSLRLSWKSQLAVDDGENVYQPGTYEHRVNFTVLEKTVYPALPSNTIGQHPYTSENAGLDFLLYLPEDYGKDPRQKWPLIVYLHGAPVRGATLELLMKEPLPQQLDTENDFPFIVLSPLGDGEYEFWAKDEMIDALFTLLDEIQTAYPIDKKRIYLTGNDMGGNGVWVIGLRHLEYFAALAPVAGYASYPFEVPENICDLKNVPVWAFHGERDPFVPAQVEQDLIETLITCGGDAQISLSHRMSMDVPYQVYKDPRLYEWLLSQAQK